MTTLQQKWTCVVGPLHTLKSSLGFLNRRRSVRAACVAGEAGGLASCPGAERRGLPTSSGEPEPEQAIDASLEVHGGEADARELPELDTRLLLEKEPSASTDAAAFLTTNGDIIQYLKPCTQHHTTHQMLLLTSFDSLRVMRR